MVADPNNSTFLVEAAYTEDDGLSVPDGERPET